MLTAVVLAKNEAKRIKACLKSLTFADEVLVIDDESTDKTAEIANKVGAKVISHPLNRDFAAQRNFGLEQCKPGWALFIDADETVSPALAKEIKEVTKSKTTKGYYLHRIDTFMGREMKHGEVGQTKIMRLAQHNAGRWNRAVHETWEIKGETKTLTNPLLHQPHQDLTSFFEDINQYSTLHAQVLYHQRVKTNLAAIITYPTAKFLLNYILRLGFLDGMPGLILALMMSFHSFLARGKLYMLTKKGPVEYEEVK